MVKNRYLNAQQVKIDINNINEQFIIVFYNIDNIEYTHKLVIDVKTAKNLKTALDNAVISYFAP